MEERSCRFEVVSARACSGEMAVYTVVLKKHFRRSMGFRQGLDGGGGVQVFVQVLYGTGRSRRSGADA